MPTKSNFEPKLYHLVEQAYKKRASITSYNEIYDLYAPSKKISFNSTRLSGFFDRMDSIAKKKIVGEIVVQSGWEKWETARESLKQMEDTEFEKRLGEIWETFIHFRRPNYNLDLATKRLYMRFKPPEAKNAWNMMEQMIPMFSAVGGFQSVKVAMPGECGRKDHLVAYFNTDTHRAMVLERLDNYIKKTRQLFRSDTPGNEKIPGLGLADEPPEAMLDEDGSSEYINGKWLIHGNNSLGMYISKTIWWAVDEIKKREARPMRGPKDFNAYLGLVLQAFRIAGVNPKRWFTFSVQQRRRLQHVQSRMLDVRRIRRKRNI